MIEADFLTRLRALPLHPGAHGLADDVASLAGFVLTTDTLVEGVHFLPGDLPADVAWKLLATNLSDLAAKGATVEGVLLNYPLRDEAWDRAFVDGLDAALRRFSCRLLGGDTVTLPAGAPRVLTLTAIGADAPAPPRSGARAGDVLYVAGTIGDAGAGLDVARGVLAPSRYAPERAVALLAAYRRPVPLLSQGRALAPLVHAMMDVSDGLLIDAARMAAASGLRAAIDLARLPLSPAFVAIAGDQPEARLRAATAGDDYALLFAAAPDVVLPVRAAAIGRFEAGDGLALFDDGEPVALPATLGYQHGLR